MPDNALDRKGELGRYSTRPNQKLTRQCERNFAPLRGYIKIKEQYMNMLTFCSIKYMNRSFFSKTRYMIGVGTPIPKLPSSYHPEVGDNFFKLCSIQSLGQIIYFLVNASPP